MHLEKPQPSRRQSTTIPAAAKRTILPTAKIIPLDTKPHRTRRRILRPKPRFILRRHPSRRHVTRTPPIHTKLDTKTPKLPHRKPASKTPKLQRRISTKPARATGIPRPAIHDPKQQPVRIQRKHALKLQPRRVAPNTETTTQLDTLIQRLPRNTRTVQRIPNNKTQLDIRHVQQQKIQRTADTQPAITPNLTHPTMPSQTASAKTS